MATKVKISNLEENTFYKIHVYKKTNISQNFDSWDQSKTLLIDATTEQGPVNCVGYWSECGFNKSGRCRNEGHHQHNEYSLGRCINERAYIITQKAENGGQECPYNETNYQQCNFEGEICSSLGVEYDEDDNYIISNCLFLSNRYYSDLSSIKTNNPNDCRNECLNDADCSGFVWSDQVNTDKRIYNLDTHDLGGGGFGIRRYPATCYFKKTNNNNEAEVHVTPAPMEAAISYIKKSLPQKLVGEPHDNLN